LTGITEPIEFAFLFVAPLLLTSLHAVLTGRRSRSSTLLEIKIGFGFSAGLIDYVLNFRQGEHDEGASAARRGLVYFVVYYFVFSSLSALRPATPGRGEASTGLSSDWILPKASGAREGEEAERESKPARGTRGRA
jgi:PTS system N-acetylglucosamine-specific IIC component